MKNTIYKLLENESNEVVFCFLLRMAEGENLNNKALTVKLTENQIQGFYWYRNFFKMMLSSNLYPGLL